MKSIRRLLICLAFAAVAQSHCYARVLLLSDRFPGSSLGFYSALKSAVHRSSLELEEVRGAELADKLSAFTGGDILILPNAPFFPAAAKASLEAFLARGNHLLAISGPAFSDMVCEDNGRWLTRDAARAELTDLPGTAIVDFGQNGAKGWQRSSGSMESPASHVVEPSGDPRVPSALHVRVSTLVNWDTFISPPLTGAFPGEACATVFWAKGGPDTSEIAVEWREKDGSRWMGNVKLTREWKRYALTPEDLTYWPDNPSKGRGGATDRFNPANADVLSIGVIGGAAVANPNGSREFWVSDIRAVEDKFASLDLTGPVIESLSPSYKTYRTTARSLRLSGSTRSIATGTQVTAAIPRSPGFGSDAPRTQRYIPVLHAFDARGELRGDAAHLLVSMQPDGKASIWGAIGLGQDYLDRNAKWAADLATDMIKRMARGLFLLNAGTDKAGYAEGEPLRLGACALGAAGSRADAEIEYRILRGSATVHIDRGHVSFDPTRITQASGKPVTLKPGDYTVAVTLSVDGEKADEISYPFSVVRFAPPKREQVVSARSGDFYLDGRRWHGTGMNYWPSNSTGLEPGKWIAWLEPREYNPWIIERDLALARKLRINLLSVQYTSLSQAPALMDFLARADRRGIKVIVFLPGLDPLRPGTKLARRLITTAHLPESPAFAAYDLGWEVHVGNQTARSRFDPEWNEWVVDQYGSLGAAETDWGYGADHIDNRITGPTDEQLTKDGAWNVFVAAYRRFWDDEISKRYRRVRAEIRDLDKVHMLGARSGYGGTGSTWAAQFFPFDLASGVKHLDFTSPEAYALAGDEIGCLRGGLITLYCKFVSGGKPVYWAEYGASIWPHCDEAAIERERAFYANLLSMTRRSGASGSAGWWWPGGFRLGENSDMGVVNPDGTPRPAALELTRHAKASAVPGAASPSDVVFTIDRDKYASGFAGVYEAFADQYVKALDTGGSPALKTAGTGTNSANTPLVAVGNVPCNGHNPPKYLNAEFNSVKINGIEVTDGAVVDAKLGEPVYVEASVGNTAEATWLSPNGSPTGSVYLQARTRRQEVALCPITADTPFLADATVERHRVLEKLEAEATLEFRMVARGRAEFGETVRVTLRPAH